MAAFHTVQENLSPDKTIIVKSLHEYVCHLVAALESFQQ